MKLIFKYLKLKKKYNELLKLIDLDFWGEEYGLCA